jgi:hypothetical protein
MKGLGARRFCRALFFVWDRPGLRRLAGLDFGHAHAFQSFGVVFAVENVPLFAAFEDFFFLGGDFGADFGVHLSFDFQQRGDDGDDFLANGVAVFHKVHVGTGDQEINDAMGEAYGFFACQSHGIGRWLAEN